MHVPKRELNKATTVDAANDRHNETIEFCYACSCLILFFNSRSIVNETKIRKYTTILEAITYLDLFLVDPMFVQRISVGSGA